MTCFILGVLDYVAADALKLAGNFMHHTWDTRQDRDHSRERVIQERDLKVSINVDQVCVAIRWPLLCVATYVPVLGMMHVEI